jgi:N,N'-diacetyllegionaminate synthase
MNNDNKIHIIAEAGNNHNGSIITAKKLIDVAVDAKADSVKFQIIYPEGLYVEKINEENGLKDNPIIKIRQESMLKDYEYAELNDYCRKNKIQFTSSIFDNRGIELLVDLDTPYIKIASTDLNNLSLIHEAAKTGKKLIISTGMSILSEIERTVNFLTKEGHDKIVLLHCVSVYPAAEQLMNLSFIDILKSNFGFPVGLSDHTESNLSAIVAVGKNIEYIEKHITLDKKQKGFDHPYATEPNDFHKYVEDIRNAESANTLRENKMSSEERNVMNRARRGIYLGKNLNEGDIICFDDLLVVRPPSDFGADKIFKIIGKKIKNAKSKYSPLDFNDIELD